MISEAEIRDAINGIADPCARIAGMAIGLDDYGLVRSVSVDASGDVEVAIGVTGPACMYAPMFVAEAQARVAALPGVRSCAVRLDTSYAWTERDARPDTQLRLAAARAARSLRPRSPPVSR